MTHNAGRRGRARVGAGRRDRPLAGVAGQLRRLRGHDDPDGLYARATKAGAEVLVDLHETDCGSRDFAVRDPEGNRWSFGTYCGEPARLSDVLATGWIRGSIRLGRMKPRIDRSSRPSPARLPDVLATGWIRGSIRLGRMKPRIDLAHPGRAGAAAERRRPTERGRPAERGGRAERVIQAEPGRSAELIGPAERGRSRGADPAGPSGRRSPERGDFASAAPP